MKMTIMLVEDEPLLNLAVTEFLRDTGFDVVGFCSGEEAVEFLENRSLQFDCLITDIRLGHGRTGWDVGRRVREMFPNAAIIYMSGDSSSEWFQRGARDSIMLTKPMAFEELTNAISTLLPKEKSVLN